MFKYNNKIWNPKNPEKKLKQLGITWDDVEIIEEAKKQEVVEYADTKLFYFINRGNNKSITSIYPTLEDKDYEPCTLNELEAIWKKK